MEEQLKLDYTIEDAKQRAKLVEKILQQTPKPSATLLEQLSDYIIFAMDKAEKHQKKILTDNRMVTVNKRETSFEGLVGKLENGEDGIYNMMVENKNIILTPKVTITQKDLDEIPPLQKLREAIDAVQEQEKKATGRKKFLLKKQLIEMRQDQYVIKNAYKKPIYAQSICKSVSSIDFDDNTYITEDGVVMDKGLISLYNPKHISALLCNYSQLKQDSWGRFSEDTYYLMEDLDNLVEQTLKDKYPLYYDLLIYKIDGKQNVEIQDQLFLDYGIRHSVEYISSLWRNKIPKLLAEQAQENYLIWYYTVKEKGKWKKCSRCGEVKLAHNRFFSKNSTSKDGFYSICKCCRNAKTASNKVQKRITPIPGQDNKNNESKN